MREINPDVVKIPEIIDLHTHGLARLDTRTTDADTMLAIARAHGGAGVLEILLSIHSAPVPLMRGRMGAVKAAMERQGGAAARIVGVHLEGPFLNPAMAGALEAASFVEPDEGVFRGLTEGYEEIVRVVTIAPEMARAPALIGLMAKTGIRVNMGHSYATYAEAEAGFRAGARGVTHLFNAMRPFHHREPGIAGFALVNRDVYVEVIGDLAHLSRETVELVMRMKGPDRVILVSDSVRDTPLGAIPWQRGEGRLAGGTLTLPAAGRGLIEAGFDEDAVMRAMTANPRAYLDG